MKVRFYFLTLLLLCFFSAGQCQGLREGPPETVGISSVRLAKADAYIQAYVESGAVPGGVFLIARKGKIVFYNEYGYRSTDQIRAYRRDDLFRLASMTKAVTSVAIMQLYEQGKLGLDDPIELYIPAFSKPVMLDAFNEQDSSYTTKEAQHSVTIRHLLTHTSGITYGDNNPGELQAIYSKQDLTGVGLYHESWDLEEFVNRLAELPLAFEPGSQFLYGLNMDILGRIIEVVSKMKLDDYFDTYIFKPLGMHDTYFQLPPEKYDRLVPIYGYNKDGTFNMIKAGDQSFNPDYPRLPDNGHYAGGGGLTGTTLDYATFLQALLNNGRYLGVRILSRNSIETMTGDQLILQNRENKGFSSIPGETFCLGFALLTDEGRGLSLKTPGTYEWGGYFNTKFFIDPEEEMIFVGMTQIVPFQRPDFWDRLTSIIYGSIAD